MEGQYRRYSDDTLLAAPLTVVLRERPRWGTSSRRRGHRIWMAARPGDEIAYSLRRGACGPSVALVVFGAFELLPVSPASHTSLTGASYRAAGQHRSPPALEKFLLLFFFDGGEQKKEIAVLGTRIRAAGRAAKMINKRRGVHHHTPGATPMTSRTICPAWQSFRFAVSGGHRHELLYLDGASLTHPSFFFFFFESLLLEGAAMP